MFVAGDTKEKKETGVEHSWVTNVRRGDDHAFKKIFVKYYDQLQRFAGNIVKSDFIAEEIVQEVFSEIWENRSNWYPGSNLSNYLYRAVKNRSLNYLNRIKTEQYYLDLFQRERPVIAEQQGDFAQETHFKRKAEKAIKNLPQKARKVYTLHRREGLTYKEIAFYMNISPKTVESQMSRALKILRRRLSRLLSVILLFLGHLFLLQTTLYPSATWFAG